MYNNGIEAHTITAGENVTVNYGTPKKVYNVSGITAYSVGLAYNGNFYAGKNDTVTLTLSCTGNTGETLTGYKANRETFSGNVLTMPDKDVIISAEFEKQKFTVTWQDYDKTVLETDENIEYGTTPSYDGEIPVRQGNAQYKYIFSGWTPSVEAVTDNITYTATYMQPTNTPLLSTVTAAVLSIHRQWNIIKRQANLPPPQKTTAHSTAGLTQMEIPLISAQKSQPISLLRQTGRL